MNKEMPLVSMITYCYNGERFVYKYFDAILVQNYKNLELFFYNNGSEDRTGEIAEAYKPKLEAKGYLVNIIHYKENQSTCKLKQDAFRMMKGDYFFGCDSDDLIDPNYISLMVKYLEDHPDKGIVYCQLREVDEETGNLKRIAKMIPRYNDKEAFLDILDGININFTAISYMMSRKHFEVVNPQKKIYLSKYGENYQVQMPFLYNNLQGYIEEPLGQYTMRKDSYSGTLTVEKTIEALKGQEESVIATLQQIGAEEKYYKRFLARIRKDRYYAALLGSNQLIAKECYQEYCEATTINAKDQIAWMLYNLGLYKTVMKIKRMKAPR